MGEKAEHGKQTLLEILGPLGRAPVEDVIASITYIKVGHGPMVPLAVVAARDNEFKDRFLAELALTPDEVEARIEAAPDDCHAYFLHTFAIYLLALWEDTRAFRPLLAYLAADSVRAHEQLQEMVTEDLHTILARVYDGSDLGALKRIIEDDDADTYVRDACLKSLHVMARMRKLPREDVAAYYAYVAETLRRPESFDLADGLVLTLAELQDPALRPAIDRWIADGIADPTMVDTDDIDATYAETAEELDERLLQVERFNGLLDYLCDWAWFNTDDPEEFSDPWEDLDDDLDPELGGEGRDFIMNRELADRLLEGRADWEPQQPVVRDGPKIGRNEPCPCGSGKKYKKCCRDKDAL
jgi:hypothetical protein